MLLWQVVIHLSMVVYVSRHRQMNTGTPTKEIYGFTNMIDFDIPTQSPLDICLHTTYIFLDTAFDF